MIQLIPIEPINDTHGMLIVQAFNKYFVTDGGLSNGWGSDNTTQKGDGRGDGFTEGRSTRGRRETSWASGYGDGSGRGNEGPPEEWRVK